MQTRRFGKTGWQVGEIGFGAWAIGGAWGALDDAAALRALHAAADTGVNLIDTADVYGDGHSERLVARFTDMLVPGGYLYIGHSERVTGPAGNVLQPVGPTIYRRRTE